MLAVAWPRLVEKRVRRPDVEGQVEIRAPPGVRVDLWRDPSGFAHRPQMPEPLVLQPQALGSGDGSGELHPLSRVPPAPVPPQAILHARPSLDAGKHLHRPEGYAVLPCVPGSGGAQTR